MFQRGQKIIIIESSASKKAHPRAGDVGYLDNMYLFVHDRFILLDTFFFKYTTDDKHDKDRIEKKRFIIDLGMKNNLKLNISSGVPMKFFVNKYHVNLTSTGYVTIMLNGIETLIDFPSIHSNYGIWNNIMKSRRDDSIGFHISEKLHKVPYGHIAMFSSRYNSKYRIEEKSDNEFIAWMSSMVPVISSMLKIFFDYRNGIEIMCGKNLFGGAVNNCFIEADTESSTLKKYIEYLHINKQTNTIALSSVNTSRYRILKNIGELDKPKKLHVIESINFINSLNNVLVKRLDTYHMNRFSGKGYGPITSYIRDTWNTSGILSKKMQIKEILPVIDIVKSILCRTMVTRCNTNEKVNLVSNYLPISWSDSPKSKIASINSIKLESGNDSSALNRIYDIM